jgi:hypothetical protein
MNLLIGLAISNITAQFQSAGEEKKVGMKCIFQDRNNKLRATVLKRTMAKSFLSFNNSERLT